MFYTYILRSTKTNPLRSREGEASKTYVGFCNNINNRIQKHNSGQVKSTKRFIPWQILHLEEYQTAQEAKYREQYWKSGAGRRKLKHFFSEGVLLR